MENKDLVRDIDDPEETPEFKSKYEETMAMLQKEWDHNEVLYHNSRHRNRGIRSSQIAALVGLLIKKGILK